MDLPQRAQRAAEENHGLPSAAKPQPNFSPRITRINANRRAKDWLLDFAKLSECDTSPYRFGSNRVQAQKRCEDARHSKSTSSEISFLNPRQLA